MKLCLRVFAGVRTGSLRRDAGFRPKEGRVAGWQRRVRKTPAARGETDYRQMLAGTLRRESVVNGLMKEYAFAA
jgi:hypothetical protein